MFRRLSHSSVFVLDQDEALAFYVGKLGMEVSADVDLGSMRWLTVCVPGDDRHVLLELPEGPGMDPASGTAIRETLTRGGMGLGFVLDTDDARATHAELVRRGVEVLSDPIDAPYGIDFGVRDPFGNHLRVTQSKDVSDEELQAVYDARRAAG